MVTKSTVYAIPVATMYRINVSISSVYNERRSTRRKTVYLP
jgi:hypothetical protein